jgi:hypothetical protein
MARFCKHFLLLTSAFLLLTSCQEGREAGDLWGQWRMKNTNDRYISFSGSITIFRDAKGKKVFGNFQHVGDSLFIQCSSIKGEQKDTTYIEEHFGFKPFSNIRMKIDNLDDDNLVLSQDGKTWSFYKY